MQPNKSFVENFIIYTTALVNLVPWLKSVMF